MQEAAGKIHFPINVASIPHDNKKTFLIMAFIKYGRSRIHPGHSLHLPKLRKRCITEIIAAPMAALSIG